MRTTLGQLRHSTPEEPSAARAAGLDRLPALCDAVTAAGAPVTVSIEGAQRPLPTAVDHAAYRILQESLTNVLRHAGTEARAAVCLRYEPAALAIRVTDDGTGPAPARPGGAAGQPGSAAGQPGNAAGQPSNASGQRASTEHQAGAGHGLTGMAERVAAIGGEVSAGTRAEGGFEVLARLPIAGETG